MGGQDGLSAFRKHPGRKSDKRKKSGYTSWIHFVPLALGRDDLRRSVIYSPSGGA
jgi:hypothetical protein